MPNKKEMSDYEFLKAWGGWQNFMLSYGLKPWNLDDVEEGKVILEQLKKSAVEDAKEAEASGSKK